MIFHNCEKNRHKFEARYDEKMGEHPGMRMNNLGGEEQAKILEQFRSKTYIYDICVICGTTVKKGA